MTTRGNEKAILKSFMYLALAALALSGCATAETARTVKAGDKVGVHFTCWLKNGELAASTYRDVNESSLPKSALFVKRSGGDAVLVEAGKHEPTGPAINRKSFEDTIIDELAGAVVGMEQGQTADLEVTADRIAGLPQQEQFVKISRVWKQAKEMKIPLENFRAMRRKEPVVGDLFTVYNAVPGKVVSVSADEVLVRFAAKEGEVNLPFGKGIVRDKDDHYEIGIQPVKGTLIRTGGMVGRISDFDEDFITLDYGHPFGGEALNCEVKVESVKPGAVKETANSATDPSGAGTVKAEGLERLKDALSKAAAEGSHAVNVDMRAEDVQPGDLVTVSYTAELEDGSVFGTNVDAVAKDPSVKKVSWFVQPQAHAGAEIVAGKTELFPGLGEAVVGMSPGGKKQIKLTPDKAFGEADPQKRTQLPCVITVPMTIRMPAAEYAQRFSSFPVLNREVDFVPYFKARVTEVTEHDVRLEFLAKDGQTVSESYGTVAVAVSGDKITTTLKPLIGARFPAGDGFGIITETDGKTFTVDTNNPLAGKSIVIDVQVLSVAKAADLKTAAVGWIDDYDRGLAEAKKEGKPVFLILYADWCGWCRKTFGEIIPDPRIARLKDSFVWVKVNSDKETKYKQMYGQEGFPMMVLLRPDGTVAEKISGFRDGFALSGILREFQESSKPGEVKGKIVSATLPH